MKIFNIFLVVEHVFYLHLNCGSAIRSNFDKRLFYLSVIELSRRFLYNVPGMFYVFEPGIGLTDTHS